MSVKTVTICDRCEKVCHNAPERVLESDLCDVCTAALRAWMSPANDGNAPGKYVNNAACVRLIHDVHGAGTFCARDISRLTGSSMTSAYNRTAHMNTIGLIERVSVGRYRLVTAERLAK